MPVPGARVLLHRVGREEQGPIDSVRADAAGRFRFRFQPDTSVYVTVEEGLLKLSSQSEYEETNEAAAPAKK